MMHLCDLMEIVCGKCESTGHITIKETIEDGLCEGEEVTLVRYEYRCAECGLLLDSEETPVFTITVPVGKLGSD